MCFLSKDLIVFWSFWYSFIYFLSVFNIILCNTLLPKDRAHAIPAKNASTIKPTPVSDNVTDVVVEPIKTTVSTDSNIEVNVLSFSCFFFDLQCLTLR